MQTSIISMTEIAKRLDAADAFRDDVICFFETAPGLRWPGWSDRPFYINARTFLLVTAGRIGVSVNGKDSVLVKNDLVVLSPIHLVRLFDWDAAARCAVLSVNRSFLAEPVGQQPVYLFDFPVVHLRSREREHLFGCLVRLRRQIGRRNHRLHLEAVRNALQGFMIELYDILLRGRYASTAPSREKNAVIFQRLVGLVLENYRTQHTVPFYAEQLNMSPQNLSRITRSLAGITPSDFISEMLFCEARHLLVWTTLTVQEIAEELRFSDQSAFGKFFRRKAGCSPALYRRENR